MSGNRREQRVTPPSAGEAPGNRWWSCWVEKRENSWKWTHASLPIGKTPQSTYSCIQSEWPLFQTEKTHQLFIEHMILLLSEDSSDSFPDGDQTVIVEQTWTSVWEDLSPSARRWMPSTPSQLQGRCMNSSTRMTAKVKAGKVLAYFSKWGQLHDSWVPEQGEWSCW